MHLHDLGPSLCQETFSKFTRKDGMLSRQEFSSGESREYFSNRRDCLIARQFIILEGDQGNTLQEVFEVGRTDGIRKISYVNGVIVDIIYFGNTRADGLYRRKINVQKSKASYRTP
jgi:hypothetical protein